MTHEKIETKPKMPRFKKPINQQSERKKCRKLQRSAHDSENKGNYKGAQLGERTIEEQIDAILCYLDDGTDEDERELRAIAEDEGTELPTIKRKILKTGREIWTIGEPPDATEEDW